MSWTAMRDDFRTRTHPGDAIRQLIAGQPTTVDRADAASIVQAIGERGDDAVVDLTALRIAGNRYLFHRIPADGRRPRSQMPHIPSFLVDQFQRQLTESGVTFHTATVDPVDLRSTQTDLDATKVGRMIAAIRQGRFTASDLPWVSSDGHMLDGHHRWAAMALLQASGLPFPPMQFRRVSLPIDELLALADEFNAAHAVEAKAIHMGFQPVGLGVWARPDGTLAVQLADGTLTEFHLQGRHDQQTHGNRGNRLPSPNGAPLTALTEAPGPYAFSAAEYGERMFDWRYIPVDPVVPEIGIGRRAVAMFQGSYETNRAVRQAARNLAEGRDAMDGVDPPQAPWGEGWTDEDGGPQGQELVGDERLGYSRQDLANDIASAAEWLNARDAEPQGTLYRGMTIDPKLETGRRWSRGDIADRIISDHFKPGSTLEFDYTSATPIQTLARRYSMPDQHGHRSGYSVVMEIRGAHGVRLPAFGRMEEAIEVVMRDGRARVVEAVPTTWPITSYPNGVETVTQQPNGGVRVVVEMLPATAELPLAASGAKDPLAEALAQPLWDYDEHGRVINPLRPDDDTETFHLAGTEYDHDQSTHGGGGQRSPDIDRLVEQMGDWESTQPWNLTKDQAIAQTVPGFWHKTARGSESASWDGRYIRTTDDFYALPEETRRAVAYHEAGHALLEAAGGVTADDLDLLDKPGGQALGYNAEEILAEAYSALWSDPDWFDRMGADEIRQRVTEVAEAAGFPLPDRKRTDTFHLAGTEYDHDQSTHGGGRGVPAGYERMDDPDGISDRPMFIATGEPGLAAYADDGTLIELFIDDEALFDFHYMPESHPVAINMLNGAIDGYNMAPSSTPPEVRVISDSRVPAPAAVNHTGVYYPKNAVLVNVDREQWLTWQLQTIDPSRMEDVLVEIGMTAGQAAETAKAYREHMMPASHDVGFARYIGTHEYGHVRAAVGDDDRAVIDQVRPMTLGQNRDPRTDGVWNHMSRYARTNASEAHAEAFAEWAASGGKTTNPFARAYAEIFGWGAEEERALAASGGGGMPFWDDIEFLCDSLVDGPSYVLVDGRVGRPEEFHLKGTADDHDQQSHAGGSSAPVDYHGGHRPTDTGPRIHDLWESESTDGLDVYDNPRFFTGYPGPELAETVRQLRAVRGKPDAKVTIYRAAPRGAEIREGDWVSLSKRYARTHADSGNAGDDPVILERQVPAKEVRWAIDDLMEYGWFPSTADEHHRELAARTTFHLQGQHDQQNHGNRGGMRIVRNKSIPNVSDERLVGDLQKLHDRYHTTEGLQRFDGPRRNLIDNGRKIRLIVDELVKRGHHPPDCPHCAGTARTGTFHLAGTEYDHDQSTHAGGRAATRHAYEDSAEWLIEDPIRDIHGADPVLGANAGAGNLRRRLKFEGPILVADQMSPQERRMLEMSLGTYDDTRESVMASLVVRDAVTDALDAGLDPRRNPDIPVGTLLQLSHIQRNIRETQQWDYQTYQAEGRKLDGIVQAFHDAAEGTNAEGAEYEEALADLTYELESQFRVSPAAGFIGYLNRSWTESSQDHLSQAHQIAVAGLRDYRFAKDGTPESMGWLHSHPEYPRGLVESKNLYNEWRGAFDASARATYRFTQKNLPPDLEYVTVYRGVKGLDGINTELGDIYAEINPLSSWSASPDTAYDFGGGSYVFEARVPREYIYTTAAISGLGSLPEWETILTADDMIAARIINRDPFTDQLLDIDDMYEVIHGTYTPEGFAVTRVEDGRVVVRVDEADADWIGRAVASRPAQFHLAGTQYDHDQSTHAGGRASGAVASERLQVPDFDTLPPKLQTKIRDRLTELTGLDETALRAHIAAKSDKYTQATIDLVDGDMDALMQHADFYQRWHDTEAEFVDRLNDTYDTDITVEQQLAASAALASMRDPAVQVPQGRQIALALAQDLPMEVTQAEIDSYHEWRERRGRTDNIGFEEIDVEPGMHRPSDLPAGFLATRLAYQDPDGSLQPTIKSLNTLDAVKAINILRGADPNSVINPGKIPSQQLLQLSGAKLREYAAAPSDPTGRAYVLDTWMYRGLLEDIDLLVQKSSGQRMTTQQAYQGDLMRRADDPSAVRQAPGLNDLFQSGPAATGTMPSSTGTYPYLKKIVVEETVGRVEAMVRAAGYDGPPLTPMQTQAILWAGIRWSWNDRSTRDPFAPGEVDRYFG